MQITTTEHVIRTVVLATSDRIDAFSAPTLRSEIQATLAKQCSQIIIDLSLVPFLDSAGMAVLVNGLKQARLVGGDVKLVWPQDKGAKRILHLTRFDQVFDIADRVEDALSRF